MKLCKLDGCDRKHKGYGFCASHYQRFKKGLSLDTPLRVYHEVCTLEDCDKPHVAKGFCDMHYGRIRNTGNTSARTVEKKTCTYEGCNEPFKAKGYCHFHHKRWINGTPLDAPRRISIPGRLCSVDNCTKPYLSNGFCTTHRQRWKQGVPLDQPLKGSITVCTLKDCTDKVYAKKMCQHHYTRSADRRAQYRWNASVRRYRQSISTELFSDEINEFSEQYWNSLYGQDCYRCKEAKADCVDHIVPISEGGYHVWWNFAPICKACNTSKNNRQLINL